MKTFFGSPIPFLARTDDEYVATVRRTLALPKRLAIVYGAVTGVCFGSFFLINYLVFDRKMVYSNLAESCDFGSHAGFAMGTYLGLVVMFIVFSIRGIFKSLTIRHEERLLLKFHDTLNDRRRNTDKGSTRQIDAEAVNNRNHRKVKKFLGMPIFPKKKTDTEYVEAIRKHLRWWKWTVLLHGAGACVFLYLSLRLYQLALMMKLPIHSLHLGIFFGVILGLILLAGSFSFECTLARLINDRTERLLVQYDDELNRRPTSG